jgi:hypothetical protein
MDDALWSESSRAFIANWDGSGVDDRLVDIGALRTEWSRLRPHILTATLLQSAWLKSTQ